MSKRLMSLLIAALLALGLAACAALGGAASGEPDSTPGSTPGSGPSGDPVSAPPAPPLGDFGAAAQLLANFTARTAGAVLDAGANSCYSPASLFFALGLVSAGAEGETLNELLALLGTPDAAILRETAASLLAGLPFEQAPGELGESAGGAAAEPAGLALANAAWLNSLMSGGFNPDFEALAAQSYGAGLFSRPFGDAATDGEIHDWILDNTGGKIDLNYKTKPADYMLLANALHYRDHWRSAFSAAGNTTEPFTTAGGAEVTCEYMNKTLSPHAYYEGDGYLAAKLPLYNGSMTLILPDEGVNPADLLATPDAISALLDHGEGTPADVVLQLPKFSFDTELKPNGALQSLGLARAFDASLAEFPNLCETQEGLEPYVGDIIQQTFIDVNEEGVEAAAVTLLPAPTAGAMPEPLPTVELRFTRPFVFVLCRSVLFEGDFVEAPLFIGTVNDPAA